MRSMGFGDCGGHESGLQRPIQLIFQVVMAMTKITVLWSVTHHTAW